jgi:hypothetical protein
MQFKILSPQLAIVAADGAVPSTMLLRAVKLGVGGPSAPIGLPDYPSRK